MYKKWKVNNEEICFFNLGSERMKEGRLEFSWVLVRAFPFKVLILLIP